MNNGRTTRRSDGSSKISHTDSPDTEENGGKRRLEIEIRDMSVDDIAAVFHLGEQVFTAEKTPTLYRTWDEFEVISMFNADHEYCR